MSVAAGKTHSAFHALIDNFSRGGRLGLAAVFKRRHVPVLSRPVFGNKSRHFTFALCLLLMTGFAAMPAMAAPDLSAGTGIGEPGQSVLIPVTIATDGSVAALQLDLSFDSSVLSITSGVAGGALANHVFDWQEVAPGQVRLVFTSTSASALTDGVLANLTFRIDDEANTGTIPLVLGSVVQSDALSNLVSPTSQTNGSIEVRNGGTVYHPLNVPSLGNLGVLPLLILFLLAVWVMHQRGLAGISFSVLLGVTLFSSTIVRGAIPPGDANDDGVVNAADIPVIVEQILERATAPGDPDCNEDLLVDVRDTICAAKLTENHAPDLYGPGDRLVQANKPFQTPLFATDPDYGDVLTFELGSAPAGMSIDPVSGLLSWTPSGSNLGAHSVTALVRDSLGLTDTEVFNVEVFQSVALAASNAPPVLTVPGPQSMVVGNALNTAASATDGDNDPLTFLLVNAPTGMTIGSGSGAINWAPTIGQIGSHDVAVKVSDPQGGVDYGSFVVMVRNANEAPVANDDVYEARLGVPLNVAADGVLGNDSDPNGDAITAVLQSDAGKGQLTLNADGSFDYLLQPTVVPSPVELEIWCDNTRNPGSLGTGSAVDSSFQGNSTLAVGDVDNDGDVEVVGVWYIDNPGRGSVWLMNPEDCTDQFHTGAGISEAGGFLVDGHLGLHDIDGDGDLEIIGPRGAYPDDDVDNPGGFDKEHLIAIHHDGSLAWPGDGGSETSTIFTNHISQNHYDDQGPTFVDLEGDGTIEIVMASSIGSGNGVQSFVVVYNATDGSIKWEYLATVQQSGSNDPRMPYVVDLDLDGTMEVIVHNSVIDHTGVLEFVLPSLVTDSYSEGHLTLGIGNFDDDAFPELVGRDSWNYYLFEHDGTLVWEFEKRNRVTDQIAVADFDGDGELEFADVGNITYSGAGGGIVGLQVFNADGSVLWDHGDEVEFQVDTQWARNENITAFDANRDGAMDIIYRNDLTPVETFFIFDGRDGTVLASVPSDGYVGFQQRFTTLADINGDGHTEIINSYTSGLQGQTEIWTGTAENPLPHAPPVRSQWSFQPAYVNDDGSLVVNPVPHWLQSGSNGWNLIPRAPGTPVDLELECEITFDEGSRYLGNSTLAVGDLENDSDIEIVGIGWINGFSYNAEAWILNASDCSEQSFINQETNGGFNARSHPGLLDIDGDGDLEIIVGRERYPLPDGTVDLEHLIAVHHDGSLAWPGDGGSETSPLIESLVGSTTYQIAAPTFADLDGDGTAEILVGFSNGINFSVYAGIVVYNATDGSILWEFMSDFRAGGGNEVRIPAVVDLDLDGTMEVIIHNEVLSHTGAREFTLPTYDAGTSTATGGNVVTAVANFDGDAFPEILVRDSRNHYLFNHDGSVVWEIERRNFANSQLTVADFDGDGELEYALVNCEPANPGGSSCPFHYLEVFDSDGASLWSHEGVAALELDNLLSGSENITAFDANRDGAFDLVYQNINADIDRIFIIDGRDGSILDSVEVGSYWASGQKHAFVTIADVDGDGEAELITSNTGGLGGETQVWGGGDTNPLPSAPAYRNQWAFQDGYSTDAKSMTPLPVPHWLQPGRNGWNMIKPVPNPLIGSTDSFTYVANDGELGSNEATVTFDILPAGNPPLFLSDPDELTTRGFPYHYKPIVVDPDLGDTVTFQLMAGPPGMTLNAATGEINWLPDAIGTYPVTIMALDTIGFAVNQTWDLVVGDPIVVPDVINLPEAAAETDITNANLLVGTKVSMTHPTVVAGSVYNQQPPAGTVAEFGASVKLYLSLGKGPLDIDDDGDGFTENEGDCEDNDSGIFPGAADTAGDGIDQDCDGIDGNLTLDSILVLPDVADVLTDQVVNLKAYGIFDDGTSQNLTAVASWSDGPGFSSATAGNFPVTASHGVIVGNATIKVHDRIIGDDVAPIVEITAPDSNTTVTEPVDIMGSASDANFLKYELAYAVAGSDKFTVFANSTSPVSNGVLGEFDPTLLINDLYSIRLTVYDLGGNVTETAITVQVDGNMKAGNFALSFIDLQIPVSGIPITVTRSYDSREKRSGDFGFGWFLDINTIRISTNRVLGTGWQVLHSGLAYGLVPTDAHTVSLTFPDGRVESFEMVISPSSSPIVPFPVLSQSASYIPHTSTLGELESLEENFISNYDFPQPGPVEFRQDTSGDIYNPQRFRYTGIDGTVIDIHKSNGIERIVEPNGNTLIFSPTGITHSAGKSVLFQRDGQGRITEITDPAGNSQMYSYDGNGDLRSHTDAEGNESRYSYSLNHYMLDMFTPDGTRVIRYEYDAEDRLVSTTDANGNVIQIAHDIGARQETITDRRGGVTVLVSDERGNVLSRTNALGKTTTYTYDANDNQTSVTDPLGNTSTYIYDANNKVLAATDPLGNTTTNTYDPVTNDLLTSTDPLGNSTTFEYDARGNVIKATDPLGNSAFSTYDGAGNHLSTKDAMGNISYNSYDSSGNATSSIDPFGNISTASYDANGNLITHSRTRTTTSGAETLTSTQIYDGRNHLIQTIDSLGNQVFEQFDSNGRLASRTDKNGNQKHLEYDALGRLVKIIYPDGTATSYAYDASGNQTSKTDHEGRVSTKTFDALNRVVATTLPDGAIETMVYDAAGRVTAISDALGNTRTYSYDTVGRKTSMTDALGHSTSFGYDANGRKISTTDANGNTTNFEYDAKGNLTKTVFPDTTFISVGYDALSRKTSVTDQAGVTTNYAYDALGRLTSVTDALAQVTTYAYDEVGNQVSQTDANGNTTFFEYDSQGRMTKIVRPLGMAQTQSYDANGNLITKTDFNGDTTQYAYDSNNRLVTKTLPDGSAIVHTYTATGQLSSETDHRGLTSFSHDSLNRLTKQVEPDGTELIYTYDLNGNRTSVTIPSGTTTYTYDSLNRPATMTDPDVGVTTYTYDDVGNRASTTYPNGVVASYSYDDLNRLVKLENSRSDATIISSFSYTLDSTGRRLQTLDNAGRTVDYDYDLLYRLVQEDIQDSILGNEVIDYTHDPVGNRLTKTDSSGAVIHTYDANDRLLDDGTDTYIYDSNGNTISRTNGLGSSTFTYDSDNHLVNILRPDGSEVQYDYDAAGIRVQSTVDGLETNFLVDRNRSYAQVLEERDGLGGLLVRYEYGDDLVSQKRSGSHRFYLYDGHGSTKQLVDFSETVTDSYEFDAFGVALNTNGATENNYLYTGEQYDQDSNMYYLRARYYDQNRGQFLTTDPYSGNLNSPMSLHRYLYTHGDPMNNLDPSGEASLAETLTVLAIGSVMLYFALDGLNTLTAKGSGGVKAANDLKGLLAAHAVQISDQIAQIDFDRGPMPKGYPKRFKVGSDSSKRARKYHVRAWEEIATLATSPMLVAYSASPGEYYKDFGIKKLTLPDTSLAAALGRTDDQHVLLVTNSFKQTPAEKPGYQYSILINAFSNATGYGDKYLNIEDPNPQELAEGSSIGVHATRFENEYTTHMKALLGLDYGVIPEDD